MATAMSSVPLHSHAMCGFSSQPKPVSARRKKYREPGQVDVTMYRNPKETCITFDPRVHRGNTYGAYVRQAQQEMEVSHQQDLQASRPRRRPKKKSLFDMPMPQPDLIPVDLTKHLVAEEVVVEVDSQEAQTEAFLPLPPQEAYVPQKTGIDISTQVEKGELFHFEREVSPILDVLLNKTLEQSLMEVEEEYELQQMEVMKTEWFTRQAAMMKDWHAQVQEEQAAWVKKEQIVAQQRAMKRRQAQVLLKVQAMTLSRAHLRRLVPNAIQDLCETAFPDERVLAVERDFLPHLWNQVQSEVQAHLEAVQIVDEIAEHSVVADIVKRKKAAEEQHSLQNRRQIWIAANCRDGIGPIEISSSDTLDEIEARVYAWLKKHQPILASQNERGLRLCVMGQPLTDITALFTASSETISIEPKGISLSPSHNSAPTSVLASPLGTPPDTPSASAPASPRGIT